MKWVTLMVMVLPSVRTLTYNMEECLDSCVERYVELAGGDVKLRAVGTPFLHGGQANSYHGRPQPGDASTECPWCKHTFAPNHGGARAAVPAPCGSPKAPFGCESLSFRFADGSCGSLICEGCADQNGDVNATMDPSRDFWDHLPAALAKTNRGRPYQRRPQKRADCSRSLLSCS